MSGPEISVVVNSPVVMSTTARPKRSSSTDDAHQVIIAVAVQQAGFDDRAGGDHAHHLT